MTAFAPVLIAPLFVVAVPPIRSAEPRCTRFPPWVTAGPLVVVALPPVTSFVMLPFVMLFVALLFADDWLLFVDVLPLAVASAAPPCETISFVFAALLVLCELSGA